MPALESQRMPARRIASCRLPPKSNSRRLLTSDRKGPFRKGKFRIGRPTLAAVRAFPVLILMLTVTIGVTLVCAVIIVVAARRAAPLPKARRQAMAALCAQRGLVPSGANLARDFSMLPSIERMGLSSAFSSPDGGVGVADLVRSEGKSEAF